MTNNHTIFQSRRDDCKNGNRPFVLCITQTINETQQPQRFFCIPNLLVANENDGSRRNLYLKKAECILDHLQENPGKPFYPDSEKKVTYRFSDKSDKESRCTEDGKIYESELFKENSPFIVFVPHPWEVHKHWWQLLSDWSRPFQTWIPTGLLLLLIFRLVDESGIDDWKRYICISIGVSLLLLVVFPLADKSIPMLNNWRKRRKKKN